MSYVCEEHSDVDQAREKLQMTMMTAAWVLSKMAIGERVERYYCKSCQRLRPHWGLFDY